MGVERNCPECDQLQTWRVIATLGGRPPICAWSDCACTDAYAERARTRQLASGQAQARYRVEALAAGCDLGPLAPLAQRPFDRERLLPPLLFDRAVGWMTAALATGAHAAAFDASPIPALYLCGDPGVGKSHLAAHLAQLALDAGKTVCVIDEIDYMERYWAAPIETRPALSDLPARRAWLTVLDDIGRRESRPAGLRDAWHDVLHPRWSNCGWLVVTSNVTPDQLLAQGTLSTATHSRLTQLTQRRVITMRGADQRVRGVA